MNRSDAEPLVKDKGVWGGDGTIREHPVILLGDGTCLFLKSTEPTKVFANAREAIIAKATEGLTDEEKAIAGL